MDMRVPTLLVCDDDEPFRRRLVRSLRDRGYRVYEASSAEEGLEVYREYAPQKILVDLRMPGEGGLWLVKQVAGYDKGAQIVVLTGFGSIGTAMEAVRCGAVNYVTKPASIDQIVNSFTSTAQSIDEDVMPSLAEVEAEYVQRVLDHHDGNVSKSAKVLGLHRRSLQRMLKRS